VYVRTILTATVGLILLGLYPSASLPAEGPAKAKPAAAANRQTLVIVAPRSFQKELQPLVEHKKRELSVEVAFLDNVLAEKQGADAPEKLKRFLYRAWRERHVHYVLLVGDSEVMPVRYMVLDRCDPAAFDYAFYPCDLYYADVAREDGSFDDWNAKKEGFHAEYFGEVRGEKNKSDAVNYDGIHYRPKLALGRWPVSTPEEVRTMVVKSIGYENRSAAGSPSRFRAALIHNSGWIDARPAMDEQAKSLPKGWTIEKRYYSDGACKSNDPPPPPATYQKGRYNSLGLGKQLLRAGPNGAVAYIGCSTGGQPCALALMDGFAKSWGNEPSPRLGDCWMQTVSYYYDQEHLATLKPNADWYPPSIFFQAMKYMVYGDPSLKLPH
jgi:hypothetical protein